MPHRPAPAPRPADDCGDVNSADGRVCERSPLHPDGHLDVPGGEEW